MFSALVFAADMATLSVSDRTELRTRVPGTGQLAASADLETIPDLRLALWSRRLRFAVAYAPRLTLWDIGSSAQQFTQMQAGDVRLEWKGRRVQLSISESASYGGVSFAASSVSPGPAAADPTVTPPVSPQLPSFQPFPQPSIIQYMSSSTTLDARLTLRRWAFQAYAGYQLSGGADKAARAVLPLQTGPLGEVSASYSVSRQDQIVTTLTGSETSFSTGPEMILAGVTLGHRHQWARGTETRLTAGVSEARMRADSNSAHTFTTYPVAELAFERRGVPGGRVGVLAGARIAPVVNRLFGFVEERVEGTLGVTYERRRLATRGSISASRSVPATGPNATTLFGGELGAGYAVTRGVAFDGGARCLWQRQESTGAAFVQGTFFVGVTLRAPQVRF